MVGDARGGDRDNDVAGGDVGLVSGGGLVVGAGGTIWKVVVGEGTYKRTYYEQGFQC